jgi:hypothetical protein
MTGDDMTDTIDLDGTMTVREALELRDTAYETGFRDGADQTRQAVANALSLTDRHES